VSRRPTDLRTLVDGVGSGDTRSVARAITLVENRDPLAYELVRELYPRTGSAAVVGFTGPPGVGKSSLIAAVVALLREQGKRVGVVSVDPSSPFSRGALLGDRIRLADHFTDEGVFIRSMSTRGHLGGVSEATLQALLVLDAAGMDVLLLETVGVGQSEVEVASLADTILLVLQPGSGDSIQALKAGVMEIPDVIVVNKSDHPAARTMRAEIRSVLALDPATERRVPIVETEAFEGKGIAELWQAVLDHRSLLEREGGLEARRRTSMEHEIVAVAVAQARRRLEAAVAADPELRSLFEQVHARRLDPLSATQELGERVFPGAAPPGDGGAIAVREAAPADRGWIESLVEERWGAAIAVVHGVAHYVPALRGFVAEADGRPVGLATYAIEDDDCELVTIDSLEPGRGVGAALVAAVAGAARAAGCRRVWCITTNDNVAALRFYQRHGFRLVALHPGAVARSRELKPQIPETGADGIPIRDELELELAL
jgi:LAO/AO transport system kinase